MNQSKHTERWGNEAETGTKSGTGHLLRESAGLEAWCESPWIVGSAERRRAHD